MTFNETFSFTRISPEEVNTMGLRVRLYGCERMRREHLVGETVLPFQCLALDQPSTMWLMLEPRSNLAHWDSKCEISSLARSDSTSSAQSMQHGGLPELLLGLAYNGTTGRLAAEVIKGSHFRNVTMNRAPESVRYRNGLVFTLMVEMQPTRCRRCAHSSRAPYHVLPRHGQQRRPWHLRAVESRFRRRHVCEAHTDVIKWTGDNTEQDICPAWSAKSPLQRNLRVSGGSFPASRRDVDGLRLLQAIDEAEGHDWLVFTRTQQLGRGGTLSLE